jgi:hypothetical protein
MMRTTLIGLPGHQSLGSRGQTGTRLGVWATIASRRAAKVQHPLDDHLDFGEWLPQSGADALAEAADLGVEGEVKAAYQLVAALGEFGECSVLLGHGIVEGDRGGEDLERAAADVAAAVESAAGLVRRDGVIDAGGVEDCREVVGLIGRGAAKPVGGMSSHLPLGGEAVAGGRASGEVDDAGGDV